jgi:hypothetical protein
VAWMRDSAAESDTWWTSQRAARSSRCRNMSGLPRSERLRDKVFGTAADLVRIRAREAPRVGTVEIAVSPGNTDESAAG